MKSKYLRIGFISTILFIVSMVYTTSQLFSLQDELILGVSALSTDDISELSNILNPVYIIVVITLILGLVSILLNFKLDNSNLTQQNLYNQQNNAEVKSKSHEEVDEKESKTTIDMSSLKKAVKSSSDKKDKYQAVLTELCKKLEAGQGAIYLTKDTKEHQKAELYVSYAFHIASGKALSFDFGEGLIGQVAIEGKAINIDEIPENYINIVSGLGSASPNHLYIAPFMKNNKVIGVVEIASFKALSKDESAWINEGLELLNDAPVKKSTAPKKSTSGENKVEKK